jgi:hypothetical protein
MTHMRHPIVESGPGASPDDRIDQKELLAITGPGHDGTIRVHTPGLVDEVVLRVEEMPLHLPVLLQLLRQLHDAPDVRPLLPHRGQSRPSWYAKMTPAHPAQMMLPIK